MWGTVHSHGLKMHFCHHKALPCPHCFLTSPIKHFHIRNKRTHKAFLTNIPNMEKRKTWQNLTKLKSEKMSHSRVESLIMIRAAVENKLLTEDKQPYKQPYSTYASVYVGFSNPDTVILRLGCRCHMNHIWVRHINQKKCSLFIHPSTLNFFDLRSLTPHD